MPRRSSATGSELFIVDNSELDWRVLRYLRDWCQLSSSFDIATGCFDIGSLLALDGEWQKLDGMRILMGNETTMRTKRVFAAGLQQIEAFIDQSIEAQKEKNDFLLGVPAIVEALKSGKIKCRVYRKEKFHAKTYITHARMEVVGSTGLVGSSNFTCPGLTENIELNVQITGQPVSVLQDWYEEHWNEAEDVTPEILKVIERHTSDYPPFEVYAKALHEYFRGHAPSVGDWERNQSRLYQKVLDQYQRDGYHALMRRAQRYNGAFLCDGVGLGKTFVGLMVIERLVDFERKRVALIVPKAAREPVWEREIKKYLPHLFGDFSNLVIFNHTDLLRTTADFPDRWNRVKEVADAIVIDESHHFRNTGTRGGEDEPGSRYWQLWDVAQDKTMFLLTATPVNNQLIDLQHQIELFTHGRTDYFKDAPLGIHSLPGHFRKMENALEELVSGDGGQLLFPAMVEANRVEAEKVLADDSLTRALVVQRSRSFVKRSQLQQGASLAMFPEREDPRVAGYSVKKTYGKLLTIFERAFSKTSPLFSLAMYYPLAYYKGGDPEIEQPMEAGRQREVAALIRILFLKRFESSARAFEVSCMNLLVKLLTWVTAHSETESEKHRLERWKGIHADLLDYVHERTHEILDEEKEDEEDVVSPEMLQAVEKLPRDHYEVEEILNESFVDMDQLVEFLKELQQFEPSNDDKLRALTRLLKTDPVLKKHKVLIFSEFMATARYLRQQLKQAGIEGLDEVDSAVKRDRGDVIKAFAPYYNGSSSDRLAAEGTKETRVLISTDVLSEGLNLQDATRLINYDLHWNPVRLMQRIGRVDRRMSPETEAALVRDHPEEEPFRGKIVFWNFLPPDELDNLLNLYNRVSKKTLRISKTFGIEGRKLLKPEDHYQALKDFTDAYEGTTTEEEEMLLEYQKLLQDSPGLAARLDALPGRVFSGKKHLREDARAVFFCYALPAPDLSAGEETDGDVPWTEAAGKVQWYLYDLENGDVLDDASSIIAFIRCTPDTPRQQVLEPETLSDIRAKVDRHIKNTYLRRVQAPVGIKPTLKAWMELS